MGTLIILLVIIFIGYTLYSRWVSLRNSFRDILSGNGNYGGNDNTAGTQTNRKRRSANTEGEYAEFEELPGTITVETQEQIVTEEQVVDAEYEDLP